MIAEKVKIHSWVGDGCSVPYQKRNNPPSVIVVESKKATLGVIFFICCLSPFLFPV